MEEGVEVWAQWGLTGGLSLLRGGLLISPTINQSPKPQLKFRCKEETSQGEFGEGIAQMQGSLILQGTNLRV